MKPTTILRAALHATVKSERESRIWLYDEDWDKRAIAYEKILKFHRQAIKFTVVIERILKDMEK